MADEGQQTQQPTSKHRKILSHLPIAIIVLEVIVAIFAIGLAVDPMNSFQRIFNRPRFKLDDAATIYITIAGYILINSLFVISHLLGDRIPKRTLLIFASVGAFMHVVAGSLMVHNWRNMNGPYYYVHNNEIHPSKQYMDMLISAAVFTFLLVTMVFALTVYTISRNTPYEKIEEILLMTLYTSYLFIALMDVISQFSGDPIPDVPMFLFGVIGTILFLMATCGIFLVTNRPAIAQLWRLTTSMALSGGCSLLYLLDVFLIYLYGY